MSTARSRATRAILFALLLGNAVLELGGGIMMIAHPEKLALETFRVSVAGDAAALVALIGGATLSYALLSASAAMGVLRRRVWAPPAALLLGAMLGVVGAVMLAHGMRVGAFDLAKGVVFVIGALSYRPA